jgi:hypothetical protein
MDSPLAACLALLAGWAVVGAAGLTMHKLVLLGPTFLLRAKHQPKAKDFDRAKKSSRSLAITRPTWPAAASVSLPDLFRNDDAGD